jgi:hypothetical protein
MKADDFARALEEFGVLVVEGLVDGFRVYYFETVVDGEERFATWIDDGGDLSLDARRFFCDQLGLPEDRLPVSLSDLLSDQDSAS